MFKPSMKTSKGFILAVLVVLFVAALFMLNGPTPSKAQNAATAAPTGAATAATATGDDDSDELPIYINVVGYVQEITSDFITINGQVLMIPSGLTLPPDIQIGKVASIRGNLRNDDSILIIIIVPGYKLPTPTPAPTLVMTDEPTAAVTNEVTAEPTDLPTLEPTLDGTVPATGTPPANCNKPRQSLGLVISAAYNVSYNQIVGLHCKGYSFGVIARAYFLLFTAKEEGEPTSIAIIFMLRGRGHHWGQIIVLLNLNPDFTLILFIIDGGRARFYVECGTKEDRKESSLCKGKGGGGGKGGGKKDDDD